MSLPSPHRNTLRPAAPNLSRCTIRQVRIPSGYDVKRREPFPVYLPNLTPSYRARMVSEGFAFLKVPPLKLLTARCMTAPAPRLVAVPVSSGSPKPHAVHALGALTSDTGQTTSVGLYLDLSDLGITKWRLAAVPARMLDVAQAQIFCARSRLSPEEDPESNGNGKDAQWRDPRLDSEYALDNEGVMQDRAASKDESKGLLGALAGALGRKAPKSTLAPGQELPVLRFESDDLIATWMVDGSMAQVGRSFFAHPALAPALV
jgi:hypothetical protein